MKCELQISYTRIL